jgi:hypothetical protein
MLVLFLLERRCKVAATFRDEPKKDVVIRPQKRSDLVFAFILCGELGKGFAASLRSGLRRRMDARTRRSGRR